MKPKRVIAWALGLTTVVAVVLYGEFVREVSGLEPSALLACVEVDPTLTAWTCKQMLMHNSLKPDQVARLNREAGAKYPALVKDSALAEETLSLFLVRGVNIDAIDQSFKGWTALYGIVAKGDAERVKMLLQHGASPNVSDTTGTSLLDYARQLQQKYPTESNRAEVVRLLEAAEKQQATATDS